MPSATRQPAVWRRRSFAALLFLCTTAALYFRFTSTKELQFSADETTNYACRPQDPPKRVAIVGAGSGGASAAYYLHQYTRDCPNVRITVFERNGYVGGRSTTVLAHNDPSEPVEVGGSVFVKVNHNLVSAVKKFGLSTRAGHDSSHNRGDDDDIEDTIGVYDGEEWRYISPYDPTNGYWTIIKLLWQYGIDPIRTNSLMKSTVSKFLQMYSAPIFPFRSLTSAVRSVGLTDEAAMTGMDLLHKSNIGDPFAFDIIQASTRVNYASNLDRIHGVETMVCMAANGAMSVKGGNWQIFASMLEHSEANLLLNTTVVAVDHESDNSYTLIFQRPGRPKLSRASFDTVILASPLQFADLTLTPPPTTPISKIPYVKLHVTLFTSPYRLDPIAFKLEAGTQVPRTILTTTTRSDDGSAPLFYSISTLRGLTNPATGKREYLYKIFSHAPLPDDFLHSILAVPAPDAAHNRKTPDEVVTWRYNKIWHSYPEERPRVTFEEVRYDLAGGGEIWYTSAIEGFISTMETSSLSGMNIARLIADRWIAEGEGAGRGSGTGEEGEAGGWEGRVASEL